MATTNIKFPLYSSSEMLKLIYDRDATRPVTINDSAAIDRGQFVLAWDSDNAADDCPLLGALCSVTMSRRGEMSYGVLLEGGYCANFKHAHIIHTPSLPSVVSSRCELGKLAGFYLNEHDEPFVTVVDRHDCVFSFRPENIAYLSDVKFGIGKEEDNDK